VVINWVAKELDETYGKDNPTEQLEAHNSFINDNVPLTVLCRTAKEVAAVIDREGIERVVIGSDIVLQHRTLLSRIRITKRGIKLRNQRADTRFPNPFWGEFIPMLKEKIPVSLMSASSQNVHYKSIKGSLRKEFKKALLGFSNIYVRDENTRNMISYFTHKQVVPEISPDPVFHFNQNNPEIIVREEILKRFSLPEKYVLLSFRDSHVISEEWLKEIHTVFGKNGLTAVMLTTPRGLLYKGLNMQAVGMPLSPLEWYYLIKYSSGYIGENMHPIVVALHNAVPFYSFDDYGKVMFKFKVIEHTSKIYSIVNLSGFSENRITTLGKNYQSPDPGRVASLILNFDSEKCMRFSLEQQRKYENMMTSILN